MPTINLSGSVGSGGSNASADILAVKSRLADLGFPVPKDSVMNTETINIIKLFQSIIAGKVRVSGDGRVDQNGPTHKFLQSTNAPQWMEMPAGSEAEGFINHDKRQVQSGEQSTAHDFGTNWMIETIQAAAQLYLVSYRANNPGAALIQTNNLSLPKGGDTSVHATHETGLSCDIRVPRKDGGSGTTIDDAEYDREAMKAMLKAIRGQTKHNIRQIFFDDFSLATLGLCKNIGNHRNHAHIDIIS
jgi:hypothetical protein